METYYKIIFFILGSVMGSFFHVVATRLSLGESIVFPASHCHNCSHKLKWYELIPIVSYLIQKGKTRCCKKNLPISYLIIEIVTGILFMVCYHVYGFTPELLIGIIFISGLIIVIISDIEYMIILDEVLYATIILEVLAKLFFFGFEKTAFSIYAALGAFATMFLIKLIGDFIFKKESLGGGDIKLMFLFGLVLGYPMAIASIFLATFIAFPVALFVLIRRKDNMIPFGPFLSMAAIVILVSGIKFVDILFYLK